MQQHNEKKSIKNRIFLFFPIYSQVFRLNFLFSHTPSILFSCKRHLSSTQHNLFCVFRPRSIYRTIFRFFCFFFPFDCFSLCSAVLWKKKQKKKFFFCRKTGLDYREFAFEWQLRASGQRPPTQKRAN